MDKSTVDVVQSEHEESAPRRFIIDDLIVAAELDSELVLLNIETGLYFGLDAIGTGIWHLLDEDLDEGEIRTRLLDEFDVSEDTLRNDLREFFDQLVDKGILRVSGG